MLVITRFIGIRYTFWSLTCLDVYVDFLAPAFQTAVTYTMNRMYFLLKLVFNCVLKKRSGPKREAERQRKLQNDDINNQQWK
jgi:hypothetical protein